MLPHLRLAFAELPPRAVDHVAKAVAARLGRSALPAPVDRRLTESDALLARRVDVAVREALARDGLLEFIGAEDGDG